MGGNDEGDAAVVAAVLRAELRAHLKADELFQSSIADNTRDIKDMLRQFIDKQERAVARIHERIDEGTKETDRRIEAVAKEARQETAMVATALTKVDQRIDQKENKALAGLLAGAIGLAASAGEFAATHLWGKT
jgi:hypothetical protein